MRQRCLSQVGTFLVIGLLFVGAAALAADQAPAATPAAQPAPAPAAQPAPAPEPAAKATAVATAALVGIQINHDCIATPPRAFVTYPDGEVEWTVEITDGETATVIAGPGKKQDPADLTRGEKIKKLFDDRYPFSSTAKKVKSGKAKAKPPFKGNEGVAWRYEVEIRDAAGKPLCYVDPDICIRGSGGTGCSN